MHWLWNVYKEISSPKKLGQWLPQACDWASKPCGQWRCLTFNDQAKASAKTAKWSLGCCTSTQNTHSEWMGQHHWSEFQTLHEHLLIQRGSPSDHVPETRRACKNWWNTRWRSCSHRSTPPQGCNPTRGHRASPGGRPAWSPARPHLSHTFFRGSKERAFSWGRRDWTLRPLKNVKKKIFFTGAKPKEFVEEPVLISENMKFLLISNAIYLRKWRPCYNFLWFISIDISTSILFVKGDVYFCAFSSNP